MNQNKKANATWTKAKLIMPMNQFSTKLGKRKQDQPFNPSYETDKKCQPEIWKLMAFEYHRMWFQECAERNKLVYRGKNVENEIVRKRFVKRTRNKPEEFPIIKLKRFQNIQGKVDTNIGRKHSLSSFESN